MPQGEQRQQYSAPGRRPPRRLVKFRMPARSRAPQCRPLGSNGGHAAEKVRGQAAVGWRADGGAQPKHGMVVSIVMSKSSRAMSLPMASTVALTMRMRILVVFSEIAERLTPQSRFKRE